MILENAVDHHIKEVGHIYREFQVNAAKIVNDALNKRLPGSTFNRGRTRRALKNLSIKTQERIAEKLASGISAVASVSLSDADSHLMRTGKRVNRKRDYKAFERELLGDAANVIGKQIAQQTSKLAKRYNRFVMGVGMSANPDRIDIQEEERQKVLGEFNFGRPNRRWRPKDKVTTSIKQAMLQAANIPMVDQLIIGGEAEATILRNRGRYDYNLKFVLSSHRDTGSEMHGILSKGLVIPLQSK